MRPAILALALLGLGACNLNLPGLRSGDGETGAPPVQVWPDDSPQGPPVKAPVIGPTAPVAPSAVPDQAIEASIAGAPELSGRFWAWDVVCLPPGGRATLKPLAAGNALALTDPAAWRKAGGTSSAAADGGLELTAPREPGRKYRLELRGPTPVAFWLVILTAAEVERDRRTGAWRLEIGQELIGTYPNPADSKSRLVRENHSRYEPPRFFLKIDKATEKLQLAPHLLAGQMVSFIEVNRGKTKRRHTTWFPPNRPFIEKLERLSRELAAEGVRCKRLVINSGFRTPVRNHGIQGGANSRHLYGDAADVMVDEDGDDRMDDLNRDGVCDARDALVIAQALRKLELAGRVKPGGIGVYGYDTADSCAAFVHTDSRGFITRWGTDRKRGRDHALAWWPPEEFKEEEGD